MSIVLVYAKYLIYKLLAVPSSVFVKKKEIKIIAAK